MNFRSMLQGSLILSGVALLAVSCGKDDKPTDTGNRAPEIVSMVAEPDTLVAGNTVTVTVNAVDADGDGLQYEWEARGSTLVALPGGGKSIELTNCCPINQTDSTYVVVEVKDGHGGEATDSAKIWLTPAP